MSRIHEALQEGSTGARRNAAGEVTACTEVNRQRSKQAGVIQPRLPLPTSTSHTAVIAPSHGDYLQFEELTKHCCSPQWHPDPGENVFLNSESGTHGAEQFRTLRSRLYQLRGTSLCKRLWSRVLCRPREKLFWRIIWRSLLSGKPDCRVLLIDADLRRSRLHAPMGAPVAPGLTDYLRGYSARTWP